MALADTNTERKVLFQAIIRNAELKYDMTTKQVIAMMHKEMKQATYTS